MDRLCQVLVFAAIVSTAWTIPTITATDNDLSEEINNIHYYPNEHEEPEPYMHHGLYGPPPPYSYEHMMIPPPGRRQFHHFGSDIPYHPYMGLSRHISPKWGTPYMAPAPPSMVYKRPYVASAPHTMAYWIAKKNNHKAPNKGVKNEKDNTNTKQNAEIVATVTPEVEAAATTTITTTTTTTVTPTTSITPTTPTTPTPTPTTPTPTTTEIPTTTVPPVAITEVTEIVEIETTVAPKQPEELGEEPKQRLLPNKKDEKDCNPSDEETTASLETEANEEQPAATTVPPPEPIPAAAVPQVTPENAPASSTEAPASSAEDTSSEEEVISLAARKSMPVLPELPLPPYYPGKSLYGHPYPPMPYLPRIPFDPYAGYRRMGHHQLLPSIPENYYGF